MSSNETWMLPPFPFPPFSLFVYLAAYSSVNAVRHKHAAEGERTITNIMRAINEQQWLSLKNIVNYLLCTKLNDAISATSAKFTIFSPFLLLNAYHLFIILDV
jgi:hypothetical protein